jgi:hypothetical protein
MKRCPKCGEMKPATLEFFYAGKKWRDGFKPYCKVCQIRLAAEWHRNNPERGRAAKGRSARKRYAEGYRNTLWRERCPDRYRAWIRKRDADKAIDPVFRLSKRMRTRLSRALKTAKGGRSWAELLGYDAQTLRRHIERQFQPGMSWDNIGKWHIDHIVPVASFSYADEHDPEFKACWALANLAPRWAKENWHKGANRLYLI